MRSLALSFTVLAGLVATPVLAHRAVRAWHRSGDRSATRQ